MGTVFEVVLEAPTRKAAREATEACFAEVERLEALLSTWRPESDLSRLNRAAGDSVPVHADVLRALADAVALGRATGGAFDVTVGPLVQLWTRTAQHGSLPSKADIARARRRVGAEAIALGEGEARLVRPGMAVDLDGFSKGWVLDRLVPHLADHGITAAYLSLGQSSVLTLGKPSDADAWRLLVRGPEAGLAAEISLGDARVSVSGSFGKVSTIEGRRFGHVIDPRTGWPVTHAAQAVVVAPTAASAEAWSKALLVLAPEDALPLLEAAPGVEGLLLLTGGISHRTPHFDEEVGFRWLEPRKVPSSAP